MREPGRRLGSTILCARGSWAGGEWDRSGAAGWTCVEPKRPRSTGKRKAARVPPCGDVSGGEAAREVRRAWAWRSAVEGSGGGEDSTGRGGKMGPGAGGVPGRDR